MTKEAIHSHNSAAPLFIFSFFTLSLCFSLILYHLGFFFNFLNMAIYRKEPRGAEKFAQASWLLMTEEILLAQVSWMLAQANGCLKSWKNDHFALPFDFVFGSNKQPSKPTKSWMNLSYLNKNISKCKIYKTTRFRGSL